VLKDRVHYKDGYGYMRCLQPENCPACAAGMTSNERFGTKVLEYYTNMDGDVSKPFGYTVKAFVFGNGKGNGTYSILRSFYKSFGDKMYVRDFLVSCSNPKFQTLTFIPQDTCALKDLKVAKPEAFEEVKADYQKKVSEMDILKVVAPAVTADIMQKVVNGEIVRRSTKNAAPQGASAAPVAAQGQPSVPPVSSFAGGGGTSVSASAASVGAGKVDEARAVMEDIAGEL